MPEALEEGTEEAWGAPGLTEPSRLSESQRDVWEYLSDGEKERAARACAQLEESEQRDLVRKLDQMDREDLWAGFEAAIQRDVGETPGSSQESSQEQFQSQDQGRDRGRDNGGRDNGGQDRGRGGISRGGRGR